MSITYTKGTATVDIEVALKEDNSGAEIAHILVTDNPKTDDGAQGIGTVLLWIGCCVFAAAIVAALIIILV